MNRSANHRQRNTRELTLAPQWQVSPIEPVLLGKSEASLSETPPVQHQERLCELQRSLTSCGQSRTCRRNRGCESSVRTKLIDAESSFGLSSVRGAKGDIGLRRRFAVTASNFATSLSHSEPVSAPHAAPHRRQRSIAFRPARRRASRSRRSPKASISRDRFRGPGI